MEVDKDEVEDLENDFLETWNNKLPDLEVEKLSQEMLDRIRVVAPEDNPYDKSEDEPGQEQPTPWPHKNNLVRSRVVLPEAILLMPVLAF